MRKHHFSTSTGSPYPFGASSNEKGINFALPSTHASAITLCFFDPKKGNLISEIPLLPQLNKTGDVWHVLVHDLDPSLTYAYKIIPELSEEQMFISDPYAKSVATSNEWGKANLYPTLQKEIYIPLSEIVLSNDFDWGEDRPLKIPINDLIIYEMHVRGFTNHPSSQAKHPGTFLGVIEKIPHLIELGVNAVELMPIQEFNENEYEKTHPDMKKTLYNFWGYSTVNFFSPMNRYASSPKRQAAINEFKTMVKALHEHGIEVILDIVLNHTAEGDKTGPIISFKGIDNAVYYILDTHGDYYNFSGCGNSVNANSPQVIELIIACLRYWTAEMHVDGFRFDLASALTRGTHGQPLVWAPLIEAITRDPILAKVKLIAEPWDAAGLYQVGYFAPETKRWSEWNGKYRDSVRRFIKGEYSSHGDFARRLCGSEDLYHNRGPCNSVNFITAHDGFTLADLVSYNKKHNLENGENNQDGTNDNESWNCGVEGPTTNKKILLLRERQMKNFHLALMVSQGLPMLLMGDEYGHSKYGNNNTWCQDNDLNWFLWDQLQKNASFYRFYRFLVHFRKDHPLLKRMSFLTTKDIDWHGAEPFKIDWSSPMPFVALTIYDHEKGNNLYIAFNPQDRAVTIKLPPPPESKAWEWVVNTANPSPYDCYEDEKGPFFQEAAYSMEPHSAILLEAKDLRG